MAQLRQDYSRFTERDAEIMVVGPDNMDAFAAYWKKEALPFVGLADPDHTVADLYGQQVKLLKLGRLPALMVIDKQGQIRFKHYGNSMSDIVSNSDLLAVLDEINADDKVLPDTDQQTHL